MMAVLENKKGGNHLAEGLCLPTDTFKSLKMLFTMAQFFCDPYRFSRLEIAYTI